MALVPLGINYFIKLGRDMWKFFTTKEYALWSYVGGITILLSIWATVQIDVQINEVFGSIYNGLQKALSAPNAITAEEFYSPFLEFAYLAAIYVVINVVFNGFLVNHYCFRWRQSMAQYYHENWGKAREIEGASQRVQEDALKLARLLENLGVGLIESALLLIAFIPILWELSKNITEVPILGEVDHALVWAVFLTSLLGTAILSAVGIKLPGIEFDIQKEEAAYRKELVFGEDNPNLATKEVVENLFEKVRKIHFKAYLHYFYFNTAKWSYLQGMVIVPYLILGPSIIAAGITLGVVSQTVRAFSKVAESLQYIIRSWLQIVELISVYKRLRGFEKQIISS